MFRSSIARAFASFGLDDLEPDRVDGVERGHRLLEDDGDVLAADRAQPAAADTDDVGALQQNSAADSAVGWR
jgi:hypothetical protein